MALGLYEYESSSYGDQLAGRYAPEPPSAPRAPAPRTGAQVQADDDWAFAANMDRAQDGDEVARFAMVDLGQYETRMRRAVQMDDYDSAADIAAKVDNFVNRHFDELSQWVQLGQTGPRGKKVGDRIAAALDGSYLSTWTSAGDGRTPKALLDEQSPDGRARRADRDARALGLKSASTARAVVDRDDPAHAVYSMFMPLLDKKAAPLMKTSDRARLQAYLQSVEGLAEGMAPAEGESDHPRFSSWTDLGRFVSAFDSQVNRSDRFAGDEVLRKTAEGWLAARAQNGISANDYLAGFRATVDQLAAAQTGSTPPAPGSKAAGTVESRAVFHDATAVATRLFTDMPEAALSPGRYTAAVASAMADVRKAEDLFGLNPSRDGYAGKVVQMAKRRLGVPGSDDGGLTEFLSAGAMACSQFCSPATKTLMSALAESKGGGEVGTVPANNPYANVEMLMGQAFGRAMSGLANGINGVRPAADSWQALQAFATSNPDAKQAVVDEVSHTLLASGGVDDKSLSQELASGMVDMALGVTDDRRTLEERIRDATGRFDPATGAAAIPPDRKLTPSMQDADFGTMMNRLAANPSSVIPATRGDRPLIDAVQKFARLYADRTAKGKAVYEDFSVVKALGAAVVEGTEGLSAEIELANALKKGALVAALNPGKTNVDSQKLLSEVIEKGRGVLSDPAGVFDALLLKAVMAGDKKVPWETTRITSPVVSDYGYMSKPGNEVVSKATLSRLGIDVNLPGNAMVQRLLAMPQAADSPLLKSGLVSPDGTLDVKRFFATLQQNQWEDPDTTVGQPEDPAGAEVRDIERREKQESALRAYRRFGGTDNYLVRRLTSDCVEHARGQGYRGIDLGVMENRYARTIADAWRNGGPVAAERQAKAFTARRRRFFPMFDPNANNGQGALLADVAVPSRELLTDGEWEEQVKLRKKALVEAGYGVHAAKDDVFKASDVTGYADFMKLQARQDKAEQAALVKARQKQAQENPESVIGSP